MLKEILDNNEDLVCLNWDLITIYDLTQLIFRFQTMSDQIISRIDDMSSRIDDLEHNINDLMSQAGQGGPNMIEKEK